MPVKKSTVEVTEIRATSKLTAPVGKGWYSLEFSSTKSLHGLSDEELKKETETLWDYCNSEVDNQLKMAVAAETVDKPKA